MSERSTRARSHRAPAEGRAARAQRRGAAAPAPHAASWWERLSGTAQHAVALTFLLAVAVGFFAPALFTGKALVGTDTVNWLGTAQSMIEYRERTGEEALWATNLFGGMPGYKVSYPYLVPQLDVLFDGLRRFMWPVSHFLAMLAGGYALVYFLTRDKLAGLAGACAYGLTTYIPVILVAGHNSKFIALCYAPWVLLAFANALRRPGLLSGLLFSIPLALTIRAGHEQITYYLAFLTGIWWLVEAVAAFREGRARPFAASTGWLALGTVLALLMIAQPLLAVYEHRPYTVRGASEGGGSGALGWEYAMNWSQGIGELVTLLVADAYGGSQAYWGPKPFTGGPHYLGGIALGLALVALWKVRRTAVTGLGLAALVMTVFSLGDNAALVNRFMFDHFPLFDAFRAPETWLIAVALALAALAGIGLSLAGRTAGEQPEADDRGRSALVAFGALAALVLVLLVMKDVFFEFGRPDERAAIEQQIVQQYGVPADDPRVGQAAEQYVSEARAQRSESFTGDALRTLVFLLLALGLAWLLRRGTLPGRAFEAALVLLVVADLWGVGRRYFNEDRLVPSARIEQQIPDYGFDRFIRTRVEEAGGPGRFRVLPLALNPFMNGVPSYHYESLGGYHGAKLRLYQDYIEQILPDERGLPNENALDLLSTRYVISQGELPGMTVAFRDPETGLVVLENPDALPRAFLVGRVEVVPEAERTWARLKDPQFDPRRTALLAEPIDFRPAPLDSGGVASVELVRFSPREIAWRVRTDAPRLLVASEIYYPKGWKAYVDDEPAPIHRADYLLRAVPVPAGEHTVVMRFEPASHRAGLWISAVATLLAYGGVLLLLGLGWYRRRRAPAEAGPTAP